MLFDLFIDNNADKSNTDTDDDSIIRLLATLSTKYAHMRKELNETAKMFKQTESMNISAGELQKIKSGHQLKVFERKS